MSAIALSICCLDRICLSEKEGEEVNERVCGTTSWQHIKSCYNENQVQANIRSDGQEKAIFNLGHCGEKDLMRDFTL